MDAWRQERGEVDILLPDDRFIVIRWVEGKASLREAGVSLKNKWSTFFLKAEPFTLAQAVLNSEKNLSRHNDAMVFDGIT